MKSLLGVPVVSRGAIIGNLYITEKQQNEAFEERDEEIVRLLATQAAAAIETSRLREQLESLARLHERERIAMDLHDGVIQTVYAVTLHLEDAADRFRTRLATCVRSSTNRSRICEETPGARTSACAVSHRSRGAQ